MDGKKVVLSTLLTVRAATPSCALAVRVQIKRCELTVCAGGPSVLPESRVTSGPDPDSHTLLYPTQPELKPYSIQLS